MSEVVIVSDRQCVEVQRLDQVVANEFLGSQPAETFGEGRDDYVVDAGLFEQFQFFWQRGKQPQSFSPAEYEARVGMESHHDAFSFPCTGQCFQVRQYLAVAAVHTVIGADRYDRPRNVCRMFKSVENAHLVNSPQPLLRNKPPFRAMW